MPTSPQFVGSPFGMETTLEGRSSSTLDDSWGRSHVASATTWHFVVEEEVDDPDFGIGDIVYGQFTAQNVTHDFSNNIVEAGGFSRVHPLVMWVGGNVETISFETRLFSMSSRDRSVESKLLLLQKLCRPMSPLGRPPILRFFWGTAFPGGISCFIQGLGEIRYDEIRSDTSVRGVSLEITIKKWVPYITTRVSTESPMEQTPIHTVRDGETYEMIALRRYGDPMMGVVIRRMNPRYPMQKWAPKGIADLESNEQIKLYDRKDLDRKYIKPTSHIFDENNRLSSANRNYFFALRNRKTAVLPKR